MDLSVVIPAFNEANKIAKDIETAAEFMCKNNLKAEIIVVDDGSSDGTDKEAEKKQRQLPDNVKLEVIRYERNKGKGHAVKVGMKETSGNYVMFADSGCCVPYLEVLKGIDMIENGECDIAHGSRKMGGCYIHKGQSLYRRACSRLFHFMIIHWMGILKAFTDTQCGFKIYRGDVGRKLYEQCLTDGFMFDIEIILRAQRSGYEIKEFAIEWTCDRDSRLRPTKSLSSVIRELIAIKRNLANQ
ncbi:MAG: glycosyltransferase [Planctomycetota bacterium]|jgi:dolichyl-phosphate beta-glucosyltransferase